jgi:hypothetical protein
MSLLALEQQNADEFPVSRRKNCDRRGANYHLSVRDVTNLPFPSKKDSSRTQNHWEIVYFSKFYIIERHFAEI